MMLNDEPSSYYDLLELAPDASPQEIRAAYLRAKSAYKKDSVALYTLISEDETEDLLRKIEEAYQILSSPERRKEYDRNHGHLEIDEQALGKSRPPRNQKIVSIDRVPPMEPAEGESDILVPPSTDFSGNARHNAATDVFGSTEAPVSTFRAETPDAPNPRPGLAAPHAPPAASHAPPAYPPAPRAPEPSTEHAIVQEIEQEVEWKGPFLRKVRDARRVSIEELSDYTKISKSYILAIEEENFAKLPAPVYLRGFISQIAKFLKLPQDKVAAAYIARYTQARAAKEKPR